MNSTNQRLHHRTKVAICVKIVPNKMGSMEDWILSMAEELYLDFEVTVATYEPCHPNFSAALSKLGVTWTDLGAFEGSFWASRRFLAESADICHLSLFAPRDTCVVAAQTLPRTKVIFQDCFSSSTLPSKRSLVALIADHLTFHRTRFVVGVSKFVSERLQRRFKLGTSKLFTIYNGVSESRFSHKEVARNPEQIICVAALIPEKGVEYLLHALTEPRLKHCHLEVVGDGPCRGELEALSTTLGIRERVAFLGLRSDVENLLARSSVFVHPAVWGEAFGLTIVEAMLSSLPIVASRAGAIPELLDNGLCGILVPPADSTALASALVELMTDEAKRKRLGEAARARALSTFSLSRWVDEHCTLVRRCADSLSKAD